MDIQKIHDESMKILAQAGIQLLSDDWLARAKAYGLQVEGTLVFFTEQQLTELVSLAPSVFTLRGTGDNASSITIGDGSRHYAAGYGCTAVIEADNSKRSATFDDFICFAKLAEAEAVLSVNGGYLVQPADFLREEDVLLLLYTASRLSDKPLVSFPVFPGIAVQMSALWELLAGSMADLTRTPHFITLINSTSPLVYDAIALTSIETVAQYKQALVVTPGPIAGSTGPLCLFGSISQASAECLAGIALAQLHTPGTPVVYGNLAHMTDMASGSLTTGSPATVLFAQITASLAKHYGLPCRSGGALTDAKTIGPQSGYESMLSMATACTAGVDFIFHSAGVLDAFSAMSYEKFLIDCDICRQLEYLFQDEFDYSSCIEDITRAGHGGEFITAARTLKNCRTVPYSTTLPTRKNIAPHEYDAVYSNNIRKRKKTLLEQYVVPVKQYDTGACERLLANNALDTALCRAVC